MPDGTSREPAPASQPSLTLYDHPTGGTPRRSGTAGPGGVPGVHPALSAAPVGALVVRPGP